MNLDIRDIRKEDIEPIKAIIADTWNAKDFIEDEGIINATVTMMFISPILNKSTFGRVATLDGEVIGVIFGSRVGEITSYRLLQEDYTSELLQLLNLNDIERKVLVELTSMTNEAYSKLIRGKEDEFQGCLEFFAVSEEARGKKVGKQLFNELISYLKNTKTNKIYVYTDTMSNYGFYDHNGFVRLDEEVTVFNLPNGKLENTNFIYEYKL
ncbi:GNAT family N-acetyltransferase [Paenibacillus polymyxa]|jgi:GNAT superfamily N-acetyltransferase|uniref:GNAT family N-acetyltransferase n=1 Tax=Paenibacillus TaxID=44249 RepID=UPI000D30D0C0|nr:MULTISPECIES: GNAT family N-acetyltransferase [Paenibacillus]KAF6614582.1 GNAT family N-acetyltransferase [Paenibacillus sp. EKM101P]KAF6617097.1 GNAT family N-acetyltransferase [Paenibacillus sp. EKM102P]KAF6625408.1 GNAT family N-acetyltransferase [Paenibacillus sp. EKM10P]KAF6641415.1 GNAT family N-acetyltransferase [Paenibacillus sp. EKM11P]MBY0025276.1 GNAT family N-acetyltransferase [Paenibacillus polymyxa]